MQEGSYDIDPIKLVLAGQADFGVVGADKVLAANDKGADLVIVGVIDQECANLLSDLEEIRYHNTTSIQGTQSWCVDRNRN